jgi:hypothetical protein
MTAGAKVLLVVPPFFKYNAGPLLGPSLLQAAARSRGHSCNVVDLNALWIQRHAKCRHQKSESVKPLFQGDHNKPSDDSLSDTESLWNNALLSACEVAPTTRDPRDLLRRLQYGFFNHEEMYSMAANLVSSSLGEWLQDRLVENDFESSTEASYELVGVSLLHAGQVVPAAAISMVARKLWPGAVIAWGGPHVSGLGTAITQDLDKRQAFADVFVQGHAEETIVRLLDHLASSTACLDRGIPLVLAGSRGTFMNRPVIPRFDSIDCYSKPVVLPAQSSLGCAYGKCAFCTYPAMEGKPVLLDLETTVGSVVKQALDLGQDKCSGISLKDSLVSTNRLTDIASCVKGRVLWSACTKLGQRLSSEDTLRQLRGDGLATLEVGLESLLSETQHRIGKIQEQVLFEDFVSNISKVPDMSIVVNYMTGFPWEDPIESHRKLREVEDILYTQLGPRAKVEHNRFELERLAPMAKNPAKYGIQRDGLIFWTWASVIEQTK